MASKAKAKVFLFSIPIDYFASPLAITGLSPDASTAGAIGAPVFNYIFTWFQRHGDRYLRDTSRGVIRYNFANRTVWRGMSDCHASARSKLIDKCLHCFFIPYELSTVIVGTHRAQEFSVVNSGCTKPCYFYFLGLA